MIDLQQLPSILTFCPLSLSSDSNFLSLLLEHMMALAHKPWDNSTDSIEVHMVPERIENRMNNCTFGSGFSLF